MASNSDFDRSVRALREENPGLPLMEARRQVNAARVAEDTHPDLNATFFQALGLPADPTDEDVTALWAKKFPVELAVGRDIASGSPVSVPMSSLAITGGTGVGKSFAVSALVAGLILRHSPEQVSVILATDDTSDYLSAVRAPHLRHFPFASASDNLAEAIYSEIDRRRDLFAHHGVSAWDEIPPSERTVPLVLVIDSLRGTYSSTQKPLRDACSEALRMGGSLGIFPVLTAQTPLEQIPNYPSLPVAELELAPHVGVNPPGILHTPEAVTKVQPLSFNPRTFGRRLDRSIPEAARPRISPAWTRLGAR